jgi:hypothetical protein
MIIAIDYDDTYTKDPDLWLMFIDAALEKGHQVIVATMRAPYQKNTMDTRLVEKIPVYFTNSKAKKPELATKGINPDIWIDDSPHYVNENHWTYKMQYGIT